MMTVINNYKNKMKKITSLMKAYKLCTLLTIIGLITLHSCSSDNNASSIESIEKEITTNPDRDTDTIDFKAVSKWNITRKNHKKVKAAFDSVGNRFSFLKDTIVADSVIHIYLGWLNQQLSLTLIKASNDTFENKKCMLSTILSDANFQLPTIKTIHKNIADSISRKTAHERIVNWSTESKRDEWLKHQFRSEADSNRVFQMFRVNTVDFEYGVMHDCYFALRLDAAENSVADLIIVNRASNKIGRISNGNVEDLTQPIPPLGNHNLNNYGLWHKINSKQ
jgi:hypothetical protein